MKPRTSLLSQTWFPVVSRWMPHSRSSSTVSRVMPNPAAAFSPLAMTRSTLCTFSRPGRSSRTARRPGRPTISPMKSMCIGPVLSREVRHPGFPDDGDFDLARVGRLGLALLGDVLGKDDGFVVGDLFVLHKDPDLPACLDGEARFDAVEGLGDPLELLEPFHVGLQHLPPGAGTGRREGVGHLDKDAQEVVVPAVVVMGGDGLDDALELAEALGVIRPESGMGPLEFVVHG